MSKDGICLKTVGSVQLSEVFCATEEEIALAQAEIDAGTSIYTSIEDWYIGQQDLMPKFKMGNVDPFDITRDTSVESIPSTSDCEGGICCSQFTNNGSTANVTVTCPTKDVIALAHGGIAQDVDTTTLQTQMANIVDSSTVVFIHGLPDPSSVVVTDLLGNPVPFEIKGAQLTTPGFTGEIIIVYVNQEGCCIDADTFLGRRFFVEFAGWSKTDCSMCTLIMPCALLVPDGSLQVITSSGDTGSTFNFTLTPENDHFYPFDGPWKKFLGSQGGNSKKLRIGKTEPSKEVAQKILEIMNRIKAKKEAEKDKVNSEKSQKKLQPTSEKIDKKVA